MKRTYEWEIESGEDVWSQQIIRTKKKTPIFKVQGVKIQKEWVHGLPVKDGSLVLTISGGGYSYSHRFHDGTVWVWNEVPA